MARQNSHHACERCRIRHRRCSEGLPRCKACDQDKAVCVYKDRPVRPVEWAEVITLPHQHQANNLVHKSKAHLPMRRRDPFRPVQIPAAPTTITLALATEADADNGQALLNTNVGQTIDQANNLFHKFRAHLPTRPKQRRDPFRPVHFPAAHTTFTLALETEANADYAQALLNTKVGQTIEEYKDIGYPLAKRGSSNGNHRYDFYCKDGRVSNDALRTKKTGCEFTVALVKTQHGAWYEQTSGRHNHPRYFRYERAIMFDLKTREWVGTDLSPPDELDHIGETEYIVHHHSAEAALPQAGTVHMTTSEPYGASEYHLGPPGTSSTILNVPVHGFMDLPASPDLIDMVREAGCEQVLGDNQVPGNVPEKINLIRRQVLQDLASEGVLRRKQWVAAWTAVIQTGSSHVIPPPGYLHIVVPIGPCKDHQVVTLSDRRTWKVVVAWDIGKRLLLSPDTTLSTGPWIHCVSILVRADNGTSMTSMEDVGFMLHPV